MLFRGKRRFCEDNALFHVEEKDDRCMLILEKSSINKMQIAFY